VSNRLQVQKGIPIPETRGRKKGAVDEHDGARQAAISKGVALVDQGHTSVEAARMVRADYPFVPHERMTRLIRNQRKAIRQAQGPNSNTED